VTAWLDWRGDPDGKSRRSKGGGGSGTATFEVRRGVFQQSRMPSSMHIDIEAPLRPLPDHPETERASTGKSHIDLDLLLSGQQKVQRLWGDEPD